VSLQLGQKGRIGIGIGWCRRLDATVDFFWSIIIERFVGWLFMADHVFVFSRVLLDYHVGRSVGRSVGWWVGRLRTRAT
jgi:hypothetical protein